MKLATNIKLKKLSAKPFSAYCSILSNTYVIQVYENLFRSPLAGLQVINQLLFHMKLSENVGFLIISGK